MLTRYLLDRVLKTADIGREHMATGRMLEATHAYYWTGFSTFQMLVENTWLQVGC